MTEPSKVRSVVEALNAVMDDVQAIRKAQRNTAPGQNYMFRGIDAVMNAVGPAFRKHGVICVPIAVESRYRDVQTSTGKPSREVTVTVTYRFHGPAGDHFDAQSIGESMDSGDKGSAKAMSVAYRTLLLQALTVPTDEPDPDESTYQRAHAPAADRPEPARKPATPPETGELMTDKTRRQLFALFTELGITDPETQRAGIARVIGHPLASRSDLTETEARAVIASLRSHKETPA